MIMTRGRCTIRTSDGGESSRSRKRQRRRTRARSVRRRHRRRSLRRRRVGVRRLRLVVRQSLEVQGQSSFRPAVGSICLSVMVRWRGLEWRAVQRGELLKNVDRRSKTNQRTSLLELVVVAENVR
uniref:(northern house mosquito) hypothetical protein n=1 Tax=Culex pipiens TaxID=7175 RepID=A0A8D8E4X8_CULPI